MNMRANFLLLLGLTVSLYSLGQYDSQGKNKSRFKPGAGWFFKGWRPTPDKPARKYDRLVFDILYCDWKGADVDPFKVDPLSIGFNVNFLTDKPLNQKGSLSLGYGIQFQRTNYRINGYLSGLYTPVFNQPQNASNYSLHCNQFSIPLELRIRKESWRHFKVHLGGHVGYIVGSSTKLNLYTDQNSTQIRTKRLSSIDPLQYGAHVRLGLRNWALYASYNLNSLFVSNQGPQANALQFGLSISLF